MGQPKKLIDSQQHQPVRPVANQKISEAIVSNRETWQAAVEQLTQKRFQTMELALLAVADRVLARLGMKPTEELLDFVLLVLETDPVAVEEIEKLVR